MGGADFAAYVIATCRRGVRVGNFGMSRSTLVLLLGSCLIGVVVGELVLRIFTAFPIHNRIANRVQHPAVIYVTDPAFSPEIDSAGFRNTDPADPPDIVAIGDSHTYGVNVSSSMSWPQVLGRNTGHSVYNFGVADTAFYITDICSTWRSTRPSS